MRRFILVVCQFLLIQSALAAPGLNVGGQNIVIPAPAFFKDADSVSPDVRKNFENLVPPKNRLQMVYLSPDDAAGFAKTGKLALDRYFVLQTKRERETLHVTPAMFAALRTSMREQQATLVRQVKPAVQKALDQGAKRHAVDTQDPTLSVQLGADESLGVFIDTETAIGLVSVNNLSVVVDGKSVEQPMLMTMSIAIVNNRMLNFFGYSAYKSKADIEWVKSASRSWIEAAQKAN